MKRLGRIHSADRARAAVREARSAGFDNVSLDLMSVGAGTGTGPAQLPPQAGHFTGRSAELALLDGLLNGKGFLGKREDSELRACAAMALGKIGTREATDALQRAQGDKDVLVRNAVNRAVRGGAA